MGSGLAFCVSDSVWIELTSRHVALPGGRLLISCAMGRLDGKTALVTGADQPVGRACALALAHEGAAVLAAGLDERSVSATVVALHTAGANAEGMGLDVTSEPRWQAVLMACESLYGKLDVLVNAAQTFVGHSIAQASVEELRKTIDAAGVGTWLGQKLGVLAMRQTGGGAIVNVTSVLARVAAEGAVANSIAARGVLMASKAAALECAKAKDGIVVNVILAGPVEGDGGRTFPGTDTLPGAPLVTADEVAAAVVFFTTDGAAYMTGMELPVDGGFLSA